MCGGVVCAGMGCLWGWVCARVCVCVCVCVALGAGRGGAGRGGGSVATHVVCGQRQRSGGQSQPGQGQRSVCGVGGRGGVCGVWRVPPGWVCVCVWVDMCVCAVCRRGVCAGMRAMCRVPLRVWVWVWPVGARGHGGAETEAQRHS